MVMSFKAGNHLRFAEALVAISIYANAFSADAQVAPDIASTSASASATPTLNLRVPVMPGGTPPLASHAPSVGPFEQEVTSLENRRIEFSQRPIIFYGSSSIRRWKTLSQDFIGYPVVNCGFGGSRLIDCVRYVSRLVLRLKPAAVVLYAGDNDLAQGALPDQAFASFRDLYACTTRLFGADANRLYLRQTVPGSDPLHRQHPSLQPDGAGVPAEPAGDQIHRYLHGDARTRPET